MKLGQNDFIHALYVGNKVTVFVAMKVNVFLRVSFGAIFLFASFSPLLGQEVEGVNEKAERYHSLLLKKPGNAMVFSRFVDAWLDTGSKEGLTKWLEAEAQKGDAANWRVLAALHQYLGADEAALKALNEAVTRDSDNAELRLSRAKMQARLLAFEAALLDLEVAVKDEKTAIEAAKLKGVYLARSGQVEQAVTAWKEVIKAYPKDEDLREDLIEVEVMEGLYQDAVEASTALVEMTKDPYKKTLRRLRLGDIQILGGDREAGLKTYEEIMAATGEGTWLEREVLAQVERVFLKEDDVQGLRDFYQKLREEHPRRVSIRKVLARQMALNDEMKEAIELFREVLKITPGDLGNREEFVAFLETNEKWKEAKEELLALLEQRKDDALLWERLSRIEAKLNDSAALKVALVKVMELRKGTPEGLLATASLFEQAELKEDAEALLREGLVTFPDSLEVSEGLASFLVSVKKEEEALSIWKGMAKGADREALLRVARSLSSHGKAEVAFSLLGERVEDFENDPLILTQYCRLASSVEEATEAIPQGLALVEEAKTPTELEAAVQTALRLIAKAEKRGLLRKDLEKKDDLGVSSQCLLAAIYADEGDSIKAADVLTKAAEQEDGELARFYQVKFEEDRGNLEQAIVIMRGIIETPAGRKTVHLRRLVDLLARSGDYDKALAAVEDWKRMAPGDHSAWKHRAKLLQANGQPDEAVVELRRMIGKFGADEERRAELAAALIEAAEYTPAQRIYEQLYSESERLETKLKWVGELAQLAEREGKLEELLEDFDRRKRSNPRSVAPLLAIAEIHRVLDQYEERRSALLEASRRRPEDTELLARIAEVEERAGEFERAVGILRDAVKRDKTPESKRRLASLLLKNGEVQSGLDILSEVPGTVTDPRGLERVVQALLSAQEIEHAQSFLKKHLGKHENDWRLKYLNAMVLKEEGEHEKAIEQFAELLRGGQEIKGLKPLVSSQASSNLGPWGALFGANGWGELTPYQRYLRQQNPAFSGSNSNRALLLPLPGTPRELQLMSLLQGSTLLSEIPEKKLEAARKALSLPGINDVDILVSMMSGNTQGGISLLEERLEKDPDNLGLFAYHLVMKSYQGGGISVEDFDQAEEKLSEKHAEAFAMIALSSFQSPEITAERIVEALEELIQKVSGETADGMMQTMAFYAFSPWGNQSNGGKDMKPIKDFMTERAILTEEKPKEWQWMPLVVRYCLMEERTDDAINLINRLCQWQGETKGTPQVNNFYAMFSMSGGSSGPMLLSVPTFPPKVLKGVPADFLSLFPVTPTRKVEGGGDTGRNAQLRASLQLRQDMENEQEALPKLGKLAAQIKNPALRALIYLSENQEEEAKKLIEKMFTAQEESALLFAAGYFFDRDDLRAYEALLKVRMLPLSRASRKKVDGHLAFLGSLYAEDKDAKLDLEPAKRAALRLRRVLSMNEREALGTALVKLGLKNEAKRLASVPNSAPLSLARGRFSSRNQQDRITELKKAGNIDGAAREAAKQFRMLSANAQGNEWEFRELVEKLSSKELKEETLKKLDPGESNSKKRLLEFARAQELLGTKEKAREIYEKLLAKDSDLVEALVGSIRNTPFDKVDQERIVVKKEGKIDVAATGQIFDSLWASAGSKDDFSHSLGLCQLTTSFLEALPADGKEERNLSWVNYYILDFVSDTYFSKVRLSGLVDTGNRYSSNNEKDNSKEHLQRNKAAREVFLAMIKHPQIAEQGFMLLESAREGLGLEDEDLVKFGREALLQVVEKNEKGNGWNYDLWSKYSGNGSTSSGELVNAKGPMTWLASYAARTDTEMLTPNLMEKVKKAQPKRFALLDQAKSLAKAEPAEAEKIYAAWKDDLPKEKQDKAIAFAQQVLLFNPKQGAWADDLEKLIYGTKNTQTQYFGFRNEGDLSQLTGEWGAWRFRTAGAKKYDAFLLQLFEQSFGPSDKWDVLAKLGESSLPQQYRQAGYSFHATSDLLLGNPDLVKATLAFVSRYPLEKFVYNLDDAIQKAWSPRYASLDQAMARLVENQLLVLEEGEKFPSPDYFLTLAERIRKVTLSNSRDRKKLGEEILKKKDLNPILQKTAGATLLTKSEGRKIMQPLLEGEIEFVKQVAEAQPERSYEVFRRWFPEMEKEKAISAPLKELFTSFATGARAKKVALMESWLKEGTPADSENNGDDFWKDFMSMVSLDEALGHQVVVRVFKDLRVKKTSSRSSTNGVYRKNEDKWLYSLFRVFGSEQTQLSVPEEIRLIDHLYRSEVGDFLAEPTALYTSSRTRIWDLLMKEDAKALFRCLAELDPAQEETLSVLIMDGILGASRGELVKLNKQAKKIAKISPVFSKVLEMAKAHRDWKSQKNKQGLRKARAKYLSLLRLNGLPVSLKVDLISRVRREALPLHSGNAVFEEVTKIIAAYGATERNFALSTLNQSVESLAGLDFPGMEKVVGGLAEEASQVLLSDHAIAGRRDQSLPEVAASIVKLALQGKDAKLAVGVLKQDYNFYRGNLEVMLSLAEAGEFEVLRKLVASKTGIYSLKGLGKYDQDFHKLVTKMLSELPEENRYHLEVVLANREDDLTKGGKPHQVLRAERLERLAAVFAERSKALKGDAYLEVLAIFAAYEGSALQLEKELLAVFEKMSLADGFDFERNSSSLRSSRGFQILKRVIERKIAAKDFKEVRDKVSDFQVHLENNNGNNVWRLRYQMDAVFGIVGASLIKLAVQSPDEVETVLAETKSYFNIAMQVSHRTGPLNTFDGVGLIVSALAGKGEGWKSFLASHPDHERHQKEVGSRGRDDLFQHLGSDEWLLPAMAETRKKALRALFDNPLYKERDFDYVHDFYGLLDAEFVHVDEVIEVITGLPKDHPVKLQGMFHVASLKTYRVKGKSAAKGIAAYTEALELAQEAGDEKLANQILAHRCDVMFRNKRKKEAKADAVKVNFELLPETDQKWVKKSRTEWLK